MATEIGTITMARDTAAAWTSSNPVLGPGEFGIEEDTQCMKIGDGATAWASLEYANAPSVTTLPSSPSNGQRAYKSTDNQEYFYDGTRWLSSSQYELSFTNPNGESRIGIDAIIGILPVPYKTEGYSLWMERASFTLFKSGTGTFRLDFTWQSTNVRNIIVSSPNFTGNGTWETQDVAIDSVLSGTATSLYLYLSDLAGTANCHPCAQIYYRLIG